MVSTNSHNRRPSAVLVLSLVLVAAGYYFGNPRDHTPFDYTFRIAGQFLDGHLGLVEEPPDWLNEMVPHRGRYYSVFPLGSVVTLLPVAFLAKCGWLHRMPSRVIVVLLGALITIFCYLLSRRYELSEAKRFSLTILLPLGTWTWCNLCFGGAWQLALGFAVVGQLSALYFVVSDRRPFIAGCCFALAFGNRTEVLLLAPVFLFLLVWPEPFSRTVLRARAPLWARFCLAPLVLGIATLIYNALRFQSPFDFGYARIPGVLEEPWYQAGIFSLDAIALNFHQMIVQPWRRIAEFPFLVPTGFGGSIFLATPALVLLFRAGSVDRRIKFCAWTSVAVLTLVLWCHGNPGGWQFSYRYAMVLLPWVFLILLETSKPRLRVAEAILMGLSVAINAYATYLFYWTPLVQM